ncbi:phenoloxidase-activating factor 2-like isoform X2 [Andrena cerasifolii]|uniref:phenoloxidase-activating factor 2-like isoform X2 n=1 Tax=Andrena cerasifolii TaxID=2819439 RepID=UPI004037CEC6
MWRTFLRLSLASACLALPSPQQNNGILLDLILDRFSPGPNPAPEAQTTPSAFPKPGENPKLDFLLSSIFSNLQSTTPSTVLAMKNKPGPQADNCECVPYFLCRNETILVDGVGLIDLKIDSDSSSPRACENYLEVCCKPPDTVKMEDKVTPPPVQRRGCGNRYPEGVGFRITGNSDNEAQFGEFPWMVAILIEETIDGKDEKLNVYQCGGSLIHRQAVLTAAHCVQGKQPSELRIRAGEWDTQTKNEIFPHQDRAVKSVIVHEKYYAGALFFDVAILILSEPVEYAENVDVVCLPERSAVYDGSRCVASGWGKDVFGKDGLYQVILKKVDLLVVPRDTCQDSLRKTRLGKYFKLHESFICAGGEIGKDTCKGDGGSPLVCPSKNDPTRYQQAGIVAWGIGCGDGTPGVYANVAYVRDWIDEQMASNSLDSTVYAL